MGLLAKKIQNRVIWQEEKRTRRLTAPVLEASRLVFHLIW
jgi:hypothetical protein